MTTKKKLVAVFALVWCLTPFTVLFAQAPAPAPAGVPDSAQVAAAAAPVAITDADIKNVPTPKPEE